MLHKASEDAQLLFFSQNYVAIESDQLKSSELLGNVEFVKTDKEINKKVGPFYTTDGRVNGAEKAIEEYMVQEKWVDNIILVGNIDPFNDTDSSGGIYNSVDLYRKYVNRNVLFASINICGHPTEALKNSTIHVNDLNVVGFSDAVLNMIINKGNGGQLKHVEDIDKKYKLIKLPNPLRDLDKHIEDDKTNDVPVDIPVWQDVKVFISSTFLDMEAERNLLHQFVLPQLQRRAAEKYLNVEFVDLRWGLTEEDVRSRGQVQLCLDKVKECDLFIGILGHRYGWIPEDHYLKNVSNDYQDFMSMIGEQMLSMTQLEMELILSNLDMTRKRSFFYFRNDNYLKDLSADKASMFVSSNELEARKLLELKNKIRSSGLEVMESYPARLDDGSGRMHGLEEFGARVLNNIWNAIDQLFPIKTESEKGKYEEEYRRQLAVCGSLTKNFVGREKIVEKVLEEVVEKSSAIIQLSGIPGMGISSILSKVAYTLNGKKSAMVIPFVRNVSNFLKIQDVLSFIIKKLDGDVADSSDVGSLIVGFHEALQKFSENTKKLVIIISDIEELESFDPSIIPDQIPNNCFILMKTNSGGKASNALKKKANSIEINVMPLEVKERLEICNQMLQKRGKSLEQTAFNNQLLSLVSKRSAGSPKYLQLAIDHLSKTANFDNLSSEISRLGSSFSEIVNDLFNLAEALLGGTFVKVTMMFLYESLHGLNPKQICMAVNFYEHLLNNNIKQTHVTKLVEEYQEFKITNSTYFSYLDICVLLERIESCLEFSCNHSKLSRNAKSFVFQRYIKPSKSTLITEVNSILAAIYLDLYSNDVLTPEITLSLVHHVGVTGDVKTLKTIICSTMFMQVKANLKLGYTLLGDYLGKSLKFNSAREKLNKDPLVQEYRMFVERNTEVLKNNPTLIPQLIINEPLDSAIKSSEFIKSEISVLKWQNNPRSKLELKNHGQKISRNISNPTSFILKTSSYIITGCQNGAILFSDKDTKEDLFSLVGHSSTITGLALLSKNILISASSNGFVCSWDLEKKIRITAAKGHDRTLSGLSVRHPTIVTCGWDGLIKIWDKSLNNASTISPNIGPINCVLMHPKKELCITGGWDKTLRIWNLQDLKSKAILRGHLSSIQNIRLTEDCRKIISGSLDGNVKIWDSSNGIEVSSFFTGHGLSHINIDDSLAVIHVAHDNGIVTCWPLAQGRHIATISDRDLLQPMARKFLPETERLDPTTLTRYITCMNILGEYILLGFDNGDVQILHEAEVKSGWKVFETMIEKVGGVLNHDMRNEGLDWTDMMDEDDCDMVSEDEAWENRDWNWSESVSESIFEEAPSNTKGNKQSTSTVWIISNSLVVLGTLEEDTLKYCVKLGGIHTNVVDIKFCKDSMCFMVLAETGIVNFFKGKSDVVASQELMPFSSFDTKHGTLTGAYMKDNDIMVTIGADQMIRLWKINLQSLTFLADCHLVFKPIGVVHTTTKFQKESLFIAFADGSLARIVFAEEKNDLSTNVKYFEGNGHGIASVSHHEECILVLHTDGIVSLWSEACSEIGQYDQRSTSAILHRSRSNESVRLLMARTNIEIICPTQSQCVTRYSGHSGPITCASVTSPGNLMTAGQQS